MTEIKRDEEIKKNINNVQTGLHGFDCHSFCSKFEMRNVDANICEAEVIVRTQILKAEAGVWIGRSSHLRLWPRFCRWLSAVIGVRRVGLDINADILWRGRSLGEAGDGARRRQARRN